MTTTHNLRIERTYQAPIETVFDAWTSEEVMRRWFHGREAWETPTAEVDLRLGGNVRVVMRNPDDGSEHGGGGHYTEIDPPTRLAFTWQWDHDPTPTQITLDFEETTAGTRVALSHTSLRDQETVLSHEEGWRTCLENLARALGEG